MDTVDTGSDDQLAAEVINDLDILLRGARNFNLHINVLKRLLNLKDRQSGTSPTTQSSADNRKLSSANNQPDGNELNDSHAALTAIRARLTQLKRDVEESHLLGFCLAFNIQRLQQRLTGLPVDTTGTENVLDSLWQRYEQTKCSEAMLKYEFEEKRKLLRKLRQQLEQTRRDWKTLKLRKPEVSPSDEEQQLWEQLRADIAKRNAQQRLTAGADANDNNAADGRSPSEVDSAVHSDDGDGDGDGQSIDTQPAEVDFLLVFDERAHRLDQLEEECYELVSRLASRHRSETIETLVSDTEGEEDDGDSTTRYHSPLMAVELIVDDDDLVGSDVVSEEEDFDEAPLAEEHEEAAIAFDMDVELNNSGVLDDTEDAEISDLPLDTSWDTSAEHSMATQVSRTANNLPELRVTSVPPETTAIVNELDVQDAVRVSRSRTSSQVSNVDEEEEQRVRESLAETGEPIVLCRLRRKAVEILISRLREEKKFHESRENELRVQMLKLRDTNLELKQRLSERSKSWWCQSLGAAIVGGALLATCVTSSVSLFL